MILIWQPTITLIETNDAYEYDLSSIYVFLFISIIFKVHLSRIV